MPVTFNPLLQALTGDHDISIWGAGTFWTLPRMQVMWSLLQDRSDLKEDNLLEGVHQFDFPNGGPDGKVTRQVATWYGLRRPWRPHLRCRSKVLVA